MQQDFSQSNGDSIRSFFLGLEVFFDKILTEKNRRELLLKVLDNEEVSGCIYNRLNKQEVFYKNRLNKQDVIYERIYKQDVTLNRINEHIQVLQFKWRYIVFSSNSIVYELNDRLVYDKFYDCTLQTIGVRTTYECIGYLKVSRVSGVLNANGVNS